MSRSPKYTSAQLAEAQEAEIRRRQQERERIRAQQEHEARMRRLAAMRDDLAGRADALTDRARRLSADAADTGFAARLDEVTRELAAVREAATRATDESLGAQVAQRVAAAEAALQQVTAKVNDVLARRRRDQALVLVRAGLATEPDRHELDPADRGRVDALLEQTTAAAGDEAAFDRLYPELARAVDEHLTRARARRIELAEMRAAATVATGTLRRLLDEITKAEAAADVDGFTAAEDVLRRLRAAADAGDVPSARGLTADAERAAAQVTATFDRWQVEQDRTTEIFKAMQKALPEAGLQVDNGSLEFVGSGTRFTAHDAGRHPVRIAVTHNEEGARITYHADGHDFTVEHTAEGDVAVCDLTSAMLERFHAELAKNDVETGELMWQDKDPLRVNQTSKQLPGGRHEDRRDGR
ncbi:hypothetical protein [Paractinoplanes lichenicola]|uniref:Uncharacterized protein n=1 Tax=Paractinoplanes lichenicola TaxID=2802976 RepID=A0ABS1VDF0_9ACTN|nr:hypothetical protein [Actinoplanes lichenicola]MBL7252714.1 hypothetical protein [Actinoplanes lichenicola]